MRAIILPNELGGLFPLTEIMPTAMMPVLSRPVMVGAVEQLAQQGIKNVIVSLAHLPGSVEAYFGAGQRWNLSIEYVLQRELWGTAGAIKWAENLLTETFLVLPADQVFELRIQPLLEWHQKKGSCATRILHARGTGMKVSLTPDGRVDPHPQDDARLLADTGIYLF
ncbi:MAG TPA: sugar phosphate nucleotidyltransferase, partial [Anaerolineales bacterium]|nr:sugar phosphate nucleotidyltransferase [Anaerolineales bacterium]